jgi:hypothetical protein
MPAPRIPYADIRAFCEKTGEEATYAEKFFRPSGHRETAKVLTLKDALEKYHNDYDVQEKLARRKQFATTLKKVFDKYVDMSEDEDALFEESLQKFFKAVNIDPEDDISGLTLAWQLGCKRLGEISKEEFTTGFARLQCATLDDIKSQVRSLEATRKRKLKEFYFYMFNLCKNEPSDKTVPTDMALEMWAQLLPLFPRFATRDAFTAYIKLHHGDTVSRDLWQSLWSFAEAIGDDYSKHTEDDAWNSTIDAFANHMKEQQ